VPEVHVCTRLRCDRACNVSLRSDDLEEFASDVRICERRIILQRVAALTV
jgi:hypothetical protein